MEGFKVFLRGEDIGEQVESLSVNSVRDFRGGISAAIRVKYINGSFEAYDFADVVVTRDYDFADVVVTRDYEKPFDFESYKFSDEGLFRASVEGDRLKMQTSEIEGEFYICEEDVAAMAKALGMTGENLK